MPHGGPAFLLRLTIALIIGVVLSLNSAARAAFDEAVFRRDLEALSASPGRAIGSAGYDAAVEYLSGQIRALGDRVELQRHEFTVMVPVTERAQLKLAGGGGGVGIHPFWPSGIRPNATPAGGISGRLVYCGKATLAGIPPLDVRGQIAVIEASAGAAWQLPIYFGARAVIVLGSPDVTHVILREYEQLIPANLPRFFLPQGELADRLRAGETLEGTLDVAVTWQPRTAVNLYALVRSSKQKPEGWPADATPPAALMVGSAIDSMSLVPDLAPGAGQAVQPAAAMNLLREYAANPPDRPVIFFFSGADSIQLLGQREMLMALADAPANWRKELKSVAAESAAAAADAARVVALGGDPATLDESSDRRLIDRIVKLLETDTALSQDELFRLRRSKPEAMTPERIARRDELEKLGIRLNSVRYAFQAHPQRLAQPEFQADGRRYLQLVGLRLTALQASMEARRRELQRRVELYEWLADRLGREKNPTDRDVSQRLIELLVGLDVSDGGVRVGPMFYGHFQRTNSLVNIQDFRDWAAKLERDFAAGQPEAAWWGAVRGVFDFEPFTQIRSPATYLAAPLALPTEAAQGWGVPAMMLMTLDDLRLRRDTPADTLDRLNVDAVIPQLKAVREVLKRAWADPKFVGRVEPKRQRAHIDGQVVSPSIGRPVPDLPRDGFLVTYYYTQNATRKMPLLHPPEGFPYTVGVRRTEVLPVDPLGRYRIEGLLQFNGKLQFFAPQAYRLTPGTGEITGTSDLGKQAGDLKLIADIRQDVPTQRLLVFNAEEFALVGLYDPRFLQELGEMVALDARRNAEPQRYNFLLARTVLAGFLEPGTNAHLLFRYGRVGNRLLLLNMASPDGDEKADARGAGAGFALEELSDLGPLAIVTARDFWRLDQRRLAEYRKAGVTSTLIDQLHKDAGQQLAAAEAALSRNDATEMIRHANGAWANEARVYDATRALAGDVVRGAIFLLLLCSPFAFCMERLLIGSPNIYKQIGWTALIFSLMTAVLWSFHPAFKISSSPLIIILAFAIIFMSAIVIWVVYGKFDVELRRVRSARGSTEGASIARAGVLMSAVLLGIANMRKRKLRTLLTSLTIVLITFAVLCFTSNSVYVGTTSLVTGQSSSHSGIMLRQRGFRPLPGPVVQNLQAAVGKDVQIVERWWNVSVADPREQINLVAAQASGPVKSAGAALLGLTPGEGRLSRIAEVLGPERFARLEKGERDIIFLPTTLAEQLGIGEGQQVLVGGARLTVAGVFAPEEFDQKVFLLSGEPMTPLKYSVGLLDAGGRKLDDSAAESLDLDAAGAANEASGGYEHMPASQMAVVPAEVSRMLPNAGLRSVGFALADEARVREVSDELSRRFSLALFAGFDDGVRLIAASNLSDVSGGARVAIPLLIGGMIIFNTMMGSIAERKREIHVYTSLGLAPMHVGALFVAEAMTYGLIGVVFGYIAGQGVGTLVSKFGLLGGATLNYSGSSAMMTMGLILAVVLISALVPARLASKIAAPSIDRTWRVPEPDGDFIRATLPFTINRTAADGVLAYLNEFFQDHKEGSIGKFSAAEIEPFESGETRGLRALIWLTPFDLGIRQKMEVQIEPSDVEEIFEVNVLLQRLSGDDSSWYRMNRTFLTELRKQFLAWRSLSPGRMLEYAQSSKALFAGDVVGHL